MEKSSFFNAELIGYDSSNNPIYDREFYAEDFAEFIASFIGNGVYPNPASNLQVVGIDNNMKITIQAGNAWILGRFYQNTDVLNMDISVADGVLNRIDRVVLRLDYLNREIKAYVKKGRPSSNPTAPELVRDADMYELGLADIRINAGAIKITSADITDLRLNNTCCGVVHGTIDQVDTTAIFNQYKVWFDSKVLEYGKDFAAFEASQKGALQAFVDEFKNSLDPNSDVAIQLASKITVNETDIANLKAADTKLKAMIKTVPNLSIPTTGWTFDEGIALYKLKINNPDITDTSIVNINIDVSDLDFASDFVSSNTSFNGYVEIYSSKIPSRALIADMIIQKAVV